MFNQRLGLIVLLATVLALPHGTPRGAAGAGAAGAGLEGLREPPGRQGDSAIASLPCWKHWRSQINGEPERKGRIAARGVRPARGDQQGAGRPRHHRLLQRHQRCAEAGVRERSKGVRGMGGAEGLGLVVGVVARAVRLIQAKG